MESRINKEIEGKGGDIRWVNEVKEQAEAMGNGIDGGVKGQFA